MALVSVFVDVRIEVYICCEWWPQDKKLNCLGQEQQRFSSTPTHPVNLQLLRGPISHSVADVKGAVALACERQRQSRGGSHGGVS